MALGLSAQLGLIFWPISNYATLTYILFYLPFFALLFREHKNFSELIFRANKTLIMVLIALLSWVTISCLWSSTSESRFDLLAKTIKQNLLIISYILGIIYITHHSPRLLLTSLITGAVLVASIALASTVNQLILNDLPITNRLSDFGVGDKITTFNSVTAGIYFGGISVLIGAYLITRSHKKNLAVSALIGGAFFVCFFTAYLTGTRTALLALFILVAINLILARKWLAALFLGAGFIAALCYGVFGEASYLKAYLVRGGYGSWRPQIWLSAWQLGTEHFWFGTGMWENTELYVSREGTTATVPHSHNFYLQLLNWTGFVGLLLYVSLLTLVLKAALAKLNNPLIFISAMILIYFVIVQIFDVYNIFTKPSYYWPCIWLPIGIVIGQTLKKRPEE